MAIRPTVSTIPPIKLGPSKRRHGCAGSGLWVVVVDGAMVVVVFGATVVGAAVVVGFGVVVVVVDDVVGGVVTVVVSGLVVVTFGAAVVFASGMTVVTGGIGAGAGSENDRKCPLDQHCSTLCLFPLN